MIYALIDFKHLAGIENVLRIKRAFDISHHRPCIPVLFIHIPDLANPDAMFIGYRNLWYSTDVKTLDPGRVSFGFQDFDAY